MLSPHHMVGKATAMTWLQTTAVTWHLHQSGNAWATAMTWHRTAAETASSGGKSMGAKHGHCRSWTDHSFEWHSCECTEIDLDGFG